MSTVGRWARREIDLPPKDNPAKFSLEVLNVIDHVVTVEAERQGRRLRILDPCAGVGRIHRLSGAAHRTVAAELEPEWAQQAAPLGPTLVADARRMPYRLDAFDALVTSWCMAQNELILTDDLRWVPAGDVEVGQPVLTFEEEGDGLTARGHRQRRRWQRGIVTMSTPMSVQCVRVILDNGDEVITTPDHPWLANRYAVGGPAGWVRSDQMAGAPGAGRSGAGRRQPHYALKQLDTWGSLASFDAGWLAGLFDGEGSLSPGQHGTPKLEVCQLEGDVIDHAETLLARFGFPTNRIVRTDPLRAGQTRKMVNVYVNGGFPGVLSALGQLRPMRLLDRWATLNVDDRTVQPRPVEVLRVEDAGVRDIQSIATSTGTYIGAGYLMHNTYGNRMADHHEARDACTHIVKRKGGEPRVYALAECPKCKGSGLSERNTYRHKLGRMPTKGSTAVMPFGPGYRHMHHLFYEEALRVVRGDGLLVVNVSNFTRTVGANGDRREIEERVVEWHLNEMMTLGCNVVSVHPVKTRRNRNGANYDRRVEAERVLVMRAPAKPAGAFSSADTGPYRRTDVVATGEYL